MPIIQVNILEGRSQDQKENMINKITNAVAETLNAPAETVRIIINEMKLENFAVNGESKLKKGKEKGESK